MQPNLVFAAFAQHIALRAIHRARIAGYLNNLWFEFDRNVSVVFHAAATVRFDEPLRNAVLLNTRGTRELLALAKDMTNLKVILSLSKSILPSICLFNHRTAAPAGMIPVKCDGFHSMLVHTD
jgi:nucleoside-diphosphate-sugar epimerase